MECSGGRPCESKPPEGQTGEEVAPELGFRRRRCTTGAPLTVGWTGPDAAKELKELREHNARLKRLLAEAELELKPQTAMKARHGD